MRRKPGPVILSDRNVKAKDLSRPPAKAEILRGNIPIAQDDKCGVHVALVRNPFKLTPEYHLIAPGKSVATLLKELRLDPKIPANIWLSAAPVILRNRNVKPKDLDRKRRDRGRQGRRRDSSALTFPTPQNDAYGERGGILRILDADRRTTILRAGDILAIRVIPRGGNKALGIIATLAVAAAATAATILTAGALGPAGYGLTALTAGTLGAIAGAGVSLTGTLLIRALIPPPTPSLPKLSASPAAFSISGRTNILAPYSAIPRVYGKRQVAPQLAASPYTVQTGTDLFYRQLFMVGYGPLDLTQLKLGDTLLNDFQDVKFRIFCGYPDDPPPQIYTGQVEQNSFAVLLCEEVDAGEPVYYGYQRVTSGADADELGITVDFPTGLFTIGKTNGAHLYAQVSIQIRYAPTGTTDWVYRPWIVVNASQASQLLRGDLWPVARGQYDVEVRAFNIQPYKNDPTNLAIVTCNWVALTTVRRQAPFLLAGLCAIEVQVRATNQLNGPIQNLLAIAQSILPDYNPATGLWNDRAGSWFYDYDNQGNGASAYGLDAAGPHTATAITGKNFVQSEVCGTGDGVTTHFEHTLAGPPVQRGSLLGAAGLYAFGDNGLGVIESNGAQLPAWSDTEVYSRGDVVVDFGNPDAAGGPTLGDGNTYISLSNGNFDNEPNNHPGSWARAMTISSIDYLTGKMVFNFGLPVPAGVQIIASYVQQVITPGAGKALAITTAAATDGASVASKSIVVHQDPPDDHNSTNPILQFTVSGWYKASAAIAKGIRLRVMFGVLEDFPAAAAVSSVDVVADGPATTGWQQVSALVSAPAPPVGAGQNYFMRVVVYHNPDAVGGVTVEWDDLSVWPSTSAENGVSAEQLPNRSFDYAGAITSNPASHFRDKLQGASNRGFAVPDSALDLPTLQTWWGICNAASRLNSMILDSQGTIFDHLRKIAAIGRAAFAIRDGIYSVVIDQPQSTPRGHYTPRNSFGFKVSIAFPKLPGALKCRFLDPTNWTPNEIVAYDDGFNASNVGVNGAAPPEALDLTDGVTDPSQAWREGRFHLAQGRMRPRIYELNVDFENLYVTRGDLVQVAHDVITTWGVASGRLKAVDLDGSGRAISLETDEQLPMVFGNSYVIRIRRSDGSQLLLSLDNAATSANPNVTIQTPQLAHPCSAPLPEVGDLFSFGLATAETAQLIVSKITPGDALSARLELVDYAPDVYTADQGTPPIYAGPQPHVAIPKPIVVRVFSDDSAMAKDADGSGQPRILIQLDQSQLQTLANWPSRAGGPIIHLAGIRVQFRRTPGAGATNAGAAWSAIQAYVPGDTATYNGYVWLCNLANTNNAPAVIPATTLGGGGAGSGDSSITVASTAGFPASGVLTLDDEVIAYTAKTGTTFTGLTRGAQGSTAAAHASGAGVSATPYWTILWSVNSWLGTPGAAPPQPAIPWRTMGLEPVNTEVQVYPVTPGVNYDLRLRYEMSDGTVSGWTTTAGHNVAGQTTAPPDPTGFAANGAGSTVTLAWDDTLPPNFKFWELRMVNSDGGTLSDTIRTQTPQVIWQGLTTGGHTYHFTLLVRDTSGNYDTTPPTQSVTL